MTTSLTGSVQIVTQSLFESLLDLSTPKDSFLLNIAQALTAGAGSEQINKVFHDQRTLTTGASENLDLAGGLTDAFGNTITFTSIKLLLIQNLDTARILTIGGAAANAWYAWAGAANDLVLVGPKGVLLLLRPYTGYAVTAGTGDILKILNDAGSSCIYNIVIMGI